MKAQTPERHKSVIRPEAPLRYGICQWCLPVKGPAMCAAARDAGLSGIELDFSPELEESADAFLEAAKKAGIVFPTLGMNIFCSQSYVAPGSEAFFEEQVTRAAALAVKLGVHILQLPAFFASEITDEATLAQAARNLKAGCAIAADNGLILGTENALSLEQNRQLFALADSPALRFYFDTQNLWRMKGMTNRPVFTGMRDKLCEVHVKDSVMENGAQKWMPLGQGDAEFGSSCALLRDSAYSGWVLLENEYTDVTDIRRDLAVVKAKLG